MKRALSITACLVMLSAACKESAGPTSTPQPPSSATTVALPSATAPAPAASATAKPEGSAAPSGRAVAYAGTYKSSAGTIYVPTDAPRGEQWKDIKWRGDKSDTGIGEGSIALHVSDTGAVTGTLEGPLGPALISGMRVDGTITADIRRKDPSDEGFTGTLSATEKADGLEGTMNLASAHAQVIRAATFKLTKK